MEDPRRIASYEYGDATDMYSYLKSLAFSAGKHLTVFSSLIVSRFMIPVLIVSLCVSQEAAATEYFESYSRFKQALTQSIQQSKMTDQLPASEGVVLKYKGTLVSFESHHGQIKSDDICYTVQYCDEAKFSKCMAAVNEFFRETCHSLQQNNSALPLVSTYRQQYCGAVETLKNK